MTAVHWFLVAATAVFVGYLVVVALVLGLMRFVSRTEARAERITAEREELALLIALTDELDGAARTEMVARIEERQRVAASTWDQALAELASVWKGNPDCVDGHPIIEHQVLDPHAYTEHAARARLARRRQHGEELFVREIDGKWYTGRTVRVSIQAVRDARPPVWRDPEE